VRGSAHDRFQKCEIATIGGDVDSKIKMIELKRLQSRPEELEIRQRKKTHKVELWPDSLDRWQSFCKFPFQHFYSL
jgi:hypothetical protein